ncbi:DUF1007 family protein [Bartonella sp. LJL80]
MPKESLKISFSKPFSLLALSYILVANAMISAASAHPHIFVDAHLVIVIDDKMKIDRLTQTWSFDPLFSSGVILDFDKNGDLKLDEKELAEVGKTIKESLAEYDFFQSVIRDGKTIGLNPPAIIKAEMKNKLLTLSFTVTPKEELRLEKGHSYQFSLYDPTFYVAVDFPKSQNFSVSGLPATCKTQFIRPNVDEVLSKDYSQQTEDFFNDPTRSLDFAWQLATRLEVKCD